MLPVEEQLRELQRGVVDLASVAELRAKLERSVKTGKPLRVKIGADPTAPDIHLGHAVPLRKLRQFQDLGHIVVFIIGDFTALVGDPSGRSKTRKVLDAEAIAENAKTYQQQIFKILDPAKTELRFNSEWSMPMMFKDVLGLTARYTVARMLEREDFKKRYESGSSITMMEFLYPLIQGYDSVAIKCDVEIGGTDQLFNLLVGRDIQREYGLEPQIVLTMPLLEGLDGVEKMSKSLGNYIGINEPPEEMFGKCMRISDEMMWRYYELCTAVPMDSISAMKQEVAAGANPKAFKEQLAGTIVELYHGLEAAQRALNSFRVQFGGNLSFAEKIEILDIPEYAVGTSETEAGAIRLAQLLLLTGLAPSGKEAKRLIEAGGVSIDGERTTDKGALVVLDQPRVIQISNKKFLRVKLGA